METAVMVLAVVLLCVLFVRVSQEEIAIEDTATDEMRARTLDFYTQHLNDEGRPAVMSRNGQRSRIAESAATTKNNAGMRV